MSVTGPGLRGGGKIGLASLKVYAREQVEPGELKEFCRFLLESDVVSVKTYKLFLRLACLRPAERLASNMQSIAACVAAHEVRRVRVDGVTPTEYAALDELDSPYVPSRLREVGHGLMSMHSRWLFAQSLKRVIFEAHKNSGLYLGSVTLDDVLK